MRKLSGFESLYPYVTATHVVLLLGPVPLVHERDRHHCDWCRGIAEGWIDPDVRGMDRPYGDGLAGGRRWATAHPPGYDLPINTRRGLKPQQVDDEVVHIGRSWERPAYDQYALGFFEGVVQTWCPRHTDNCPATWACKQAIADQIAGRLVAPVPDVTVPDLVVPAVPWPTVSEVDDPDGWVAAARVTVAGLQPDVDRLHDEAETLMERSRDPILEQTDDADRLHRAAIVGHGAAHQLAFELGLLTAHTDMIQNRLDGERSRT